jgi:hypothetical protein
MEINRKMKEIIISIFTILNVINAYENKYTFQGVFTYMDVLKAISIKTERSVVGSNECLTLSRTFEINNKTFTTAMEQIKHNINADGYEIKYDQNTIYVNKKLETSDTGKVWYQVYLPYQNKYVVTYEREKYLNALIEDTKLKENDSINSIKIDTVYKYEFLIVGILESKQKSIGIDINSSIGIAMQMFPKNISQVNLFLKAFIGNEENDYNFTRKIVTYSSDTTINLVFGSEIRRINTVVSDNNVVRTQYESVYDGLIIKTTKNGYYLQYRAMDNQINIVGIPDSTISGESTFQTKIKRSKFHIFRSKENNNDKFSLYSKLVITPIDNKK